jgi:hypothetical protein
MFLKMFIFQNYNREHSHGPLKLNIIFLLNLFVATPLWGKFEVAIHTPENGTWESSGLSKTPSAIAGVKTPCIEVFFIPLERSWSVDA